MRTIVPGRAALADLRSTITAADYAIMVRVSAASSPGQDRAMRVLDRAANYSRLWMGIAAGLAASENKWGRPGAADRRRGHGHACPQPRLPDVDRGHGFRGHRPHHRPAAPAGPGHAAGDPHQRFHDRRSPVAIRSGLATAHQERAEAGSRVSVDRNPRNLGG